MSWIRVSAGVRKHDADAVARVMETHGALAVSMEPDGNEELLDPYPPESVLWSDLHVRGLYSASADLIAVVAELNTHTTQISLDRVDDRDWVHAVSESFEPVQVGHRLWICPTWCTPPDPAAVNVRLDAGPAFGTGTHPTTRMCLACLARLRLAGRHVLDYGCGSGVLALAALALGAERAWAVDVDPRAVECARANAMINGVHDRLLARHPHDLEPTVVADVVVANILAGPLIELASRLSGLTKAGGYLLLSGILSRQAEQVAAHFPHFDFFQRRSDDWVLLMASKGSSSS